MGNFNYTAVIWPTTMNSKTFNESIHKLKNACLCESHEIGKPVKRCKFYGNSHININSEGAIIVIANMEESGNE